MSTNRVRSRADDWGASASGIPIGGGQGRGHFHTRQEINLMNITEKDLQEVEEKSSAPVHPMYRTSNSSYGTDAEQAQNHRTWAGKTGKFTEEFKSGVQRTAGMNTALDKSRVGKGPQFGRDMNEWNVL